MLHDSYILGQQTTQRTSYVSSKDARAGPSHNNLPIQSHSTSFSNSGTSSVTVGQRRGKGRAFGEYNNEGRPRTKRARMAAVTDDADFEDEDERSKTSMFITARDQHVC